MMKPQKKAIVARKATKMPTVAKKRRTLLEKTISEVRKEKKSKKQDKSEDLKRKQDGEKKKSDKMEDKKKYEEKKKVEDKRKDKSEKTDKKNNKDNEKRIDKAIEEEKMDRAEERDDTEESQCDNQDKKKGQKLEERSKVEKQSVDNKKKIEKSDDRKKCGKVDEESAEDQVKSLNTAEDKDALEDKTDVVSLGLKKRGKEEKKKDAKPSKMDTKETSKNVQTKDKKCDRKKISDKDTASRRNSPTRTKKNSKTKSSQKKSIPRKTVLAKKPHFSVVNKYVDKKIKLVKSLKAEETINEEEDEAKKSKKKSTCVTKSKGTQEKKPKLAKHMKAKLPQKNSKICTGIKTEDKLKTLAEKMILKKKIELKAIEKTLNETKKISQGNVVNDRASTPEIKNEVLEERETEKNKDESPRPKSPEEKKPMKGNAKIGKKVPKKISKGKVQQTESNNQRSSSPVESPVGESVNKQSKECEDGTKPVAGTKKEEVNNESVIQIDLKVEAVNGGSTSGVTSASESDEDYDEDNKKSKQKNAKKKERSDSPSDERARRMRLFGFWSGPKRHRVASLNALAKVHCLYENETGGVYLGGFCKPKPEKEKQKKNKEEKEESQARKEKDKKIEKKNEELPTPKRKLRNVPGLRGKHWDMLESSSSSPSSDEDYEREKNIERSKKKVIKRRKKNEEVMDLKDMVVCKRMASLNASAILAASYSDEKNRCGSSSDSSSESEVEIIKRRRQHDSDAEKKKGRQGSDPDDVLKPSKKVVIVNQDTDVTITGNYYIRWLYLNV